MTNPFEIDPRDKMRQLVQDIKNQTRILMAIVADNGGSVVVHDKNVMAIGPHDWLEIRYDQELQRTILTFVKGCNEGDENEQGISDQQHAVDANESQASSEG